MQPKLFYIAGPYTVGERTTNIRAAIAAGDIVFNCGDYPIVPHLFHLYDLIAPKTYEQWMSLDLILIERCDGLIRLPGESPGAEIEVKHAMALGKEVFMSLQEYIASKA